MKLCFLAGLLILGGSEGRFENTLPAVVGGTSGQNALSSSIYKDGSVSQFNPSQLIDVNGDGLPGVAHFPTLHLSPLH
jgi:hypothetical protein